MIQQLTCTPNLREYLGSPEPCVIFDRLHRYAGMSIVVGSKNPYSRPHKCVVKFRGVLVGGIPELVRQKRRQLEEPVAVAGGELKRTDLQSDRILGIWCIALPLMCADPE